MKVVLISHGSTLEGAERCLASTVKSLVQKGLEVNVILPTEGELVSSLDNDSVSVDILPYPKWVKEFRDTSNLFKRFYQYLKAVVGLIHLLKKSKGDIVITNTVVIPCGAFAAKILGIPHIWYIHEFLEEDHGWTFEFGRKLSLKLIALLSERVIVNSYAVKNKFTKDIPSNKIEVIYQSVEFSKIDRISNELNLGKDKFCVALIGRKSPSKGQEEAIEAVSILVNNKNIDVYLLLVGRDFDGYTKALKESAERLGVSDKVSFISFVENPSSYMKIADVILMCSRCEAFGRVTVEAMKLSKAVIAANTGANPELIKDGWSGLLYQSGCSISLAEKIEILHRNKLLREELGSNAYTWANHRFDSESYMSTLLRVFNEVLS